MVGVFACEVQPIAVRSLFDVVVHACLFEAFGDFFDAVGIIQREFVDVAVGDVLESLFTHLSAVDTFVDCCCGFGDGPFSCTCQRFV